MSKRLKCAEKLLQGKIGQRIDAQIGEVQRKLASKLVGHCQAEQPGALGSQDAVGGIFDGYSLVGSHPQVVHGQLVQLRVGLGETHIVAGADTVEVRQQAQALKMSGDPAAGGAGGQPDLQAQTMSIFEILLHTRPDGLLFNQGGLAPLLPQEVRLPIQLLANLPFQLAEDIEMVGGTDDLAPGFEGQRDIIGGIKLSPGLVDRALGFQNEAVEVED